MGRGEMLDTTPEKSAAQPNSLPGYVRDTGMLVRNFDMTDFIYLFDKGKWRYYDTFGKAEWIDLEEKTDNCKESGKG